MIEKRTHHNEIGEKVREPATLYCGHPLIAIQTHHFHMASLTSPPATLCLPNSHLPHSRHIHLIFFYIHFHPQPFLSYISISLLVFALLFLFSLSFSSVSSTYLSLIPHIRFIILFLPSFSLVSFSHPPHSSHIRHVVFCIHFYLLFLPHISLVHLIFASFSSVLIFIFFDFFLAFASLTSYSSYYFLYSLSLYIVTHLPFSYSHHSLFLSYIHLFIFFIHFHLLLLLIFCYFLISSCFSFSSLLFCIHFYTITHPPFLPPISLSSYSSHCLFCPLSPYSCLVFTFALTHRLLTFTTLFTFISLHYSSSVSSTHLPFFIFISLFTLSTFALFMLSRVYICSYSFSPHIHYSLFTFISCSSVLSLFFYSLSLTHCFILKFHCLLLVQVDTCEEKKSKIVKKCKDR